MVHTIREHRCPLCGSKNIHRSKRRGIAEQLACRVTPVRPFRCNNCDQRIYAMELAERKTA